MNSGVEKGGLETGKSPERVGQEQELAIEALTLLPEERPAEYLNRVTNELYIDKYGPSRTNVLDKGMNIHADPEYGSKVDAALAMIGKSEKRKQKFSDEKSKAMVAQVEALFTRATNTGRYDDNEMTPFSHTNQNREFFGRATRTDNVPYSHSLFGIGSETPAAREYVRQEVRDKTVYLLGGGDSVKDLIASDELAPKQVVNIDPFIGTESIEKGRNGNYISVAARAEDPTAVKAALDEYQVEKADEIWASYSVPYYLSTPEQISGMFETIRQSLAEGGTARITPIAIQSEDSALYAKTRERFMNAVRDLAESPDFNVYATKGSTGSTVFIERIPGPTDAKSAEDLARVRERLGIEAK